MIHRKRRVWTALIVSIAVVVFAVWSLPCTSNMTKSDVVTRPGPWSSAPQQTVVVPAGPAFVRSRCGTEEIVTVGAFEIDVYPVTLAAYERWVATLDAASAAKLDPLLLHDGLRLRGEYGLAWVGTILNGTIRSAAA